MRLIGFWLGVLTCNSRGNTGFGSIDEMETERFLYRLMLRTK